MAAEDLDGLDAEYAAREGKPNGAATPPPMIGATTLKPRRTVWMWHPYLPAGMITILGAKGGSCKGLTCASLAATVTIGGMWPDGTGPARQGSVLWCEAEDPLPEVAVPRLIAAGADLSRVTFASRKAFADEPNLRGYLERTNTALIIQSPMVSFLQLGDITVELGVREVLERLQASIEGTDCALVGIAHSNKKADLAAIERILGAVAFTNFVRSVLLTAPESVEDRTYRLVHAKHNLSTKGDDLILRPVHVGEDYRDQYVKLEWSQPENGNADADAMFDRKKAGAKPSARNWLRSYLAEHGESLRDDVIIAGAKAGHTERALEAAIVRDQQFGAIPGRLQSRREHFPNRAWWSCT
jgi:putative DNA primase/helicase